MQKTTAEVIHRDYLPLSDEWAIVGFSDVDFYGSRAEELKKKWYNIKREQYRKYDPLYQKNESQIKKLRNQIEAIHARQEILIYSKPSKPFYRFWYTKTEKTKIDEIDKLLYELIKQEQKLITQVDKLEEENKETGNKRFFSRNECREKIENFLRQYGFVLTHTSSESVEGIEDVGRDRKREVWTLEE